MKHTIPFALAFGLTACAAQPAGGPGLAAPAPLGAAGAASASASGAAPGASSIPDGSMQPVAEPPGPAPAPFVEGAEGAEGVATAVAPTSVAATAPAPPVAPAPPALAPVDCASDKERGQLALSGEQYDLRAGKDARTLADLQSSRERPIEVCGVHDQHALLMSLTCSDGSRPLATTTQARRARRGSVGTGGRCGKIIDLYRVTCPERAYEVYMDAYFCRADQSLEQSNAPPASPEAQETP